MNFQGSAGLNLIPKPGLTITKSMATGDRYAPRDHATPTAATPPMAVPEVVGF
jgi:hypothetical protein